MYRHRFVLFGLILSTLLSFYAEAQTKFNRSQRPIADQYIVVLKNDEVQKQLKTNPTLNTQSVVDSFANDLMRTYGGSKKLTYVYALKGFSAQMSESAAVALSQDLRVDYVEEDSEINLAQSSQNNAPYGLDRIDQHDLPLNTKYRYSNGGNNVNVFIIDTGIFYAHQQFGGRASSAFDFYGEGGVDEIGHGTHVAGIIGGSTYGVAKSARLFSVRVFRNAVPTPEANVIAGIDWVTGHHNDPQFPAVPDVANMSFEGPASTAMDTAVLNLINSGVVAVVAAGNGGVDASGLSPARVPEAITVSATKADDNRIVNYNSIGTPDDCYQQNLPPPNNTYTVTANYGSLVDLFAPGHEIVSASKLSTSATCKLTGTSMATAFVSGMAALFLSNNPSLTPAAVQSAMKDNSSLNKVINPGLNSPNRLEYSLWAFSDVPPLFWAKPWIEGIYFGQVTAGCGTNPLRYCPASSVTRAQMSVFLLRSKFGPTYVPPPATGTIFADVPASHPFAAWIEQLYLLQITGGCATNPLRYCPDSTVTRAEMAVFLLRTKYGSGYNPPPATGIFADVPITNQFAPWIEQLYLLGITGGCGTNPLRYCPDNPVARDQMAVFLALTFNIPL
jgi:subtilisin family serine protease